MTYVLPNFFLESNDNNLTKIDELLCLNYISKQKNDFISVRTTMHCIIILLEGSKIIHLKNSDIDVSSEEMCFLTQDNYFMSERIAENLNYKSLIIYFDDKFIFDLLIKYNIQIDSIKQNSIIKLNYKKDKLLKSNIFLFQEYINKNLHSNLLKLKIEEIILHSLRINKNLFTSFIKAVTSTSQDRTKFIL